MFKGTKEKEFARCIITQQKRILVFLRARTFNDIIYRDLEEVVHEIPKKYFKLILRAKR